MNYKPHCDLCDHQILNLKDGNRCGLTRKKPVFIKICTKIRLNNKIKHQLEEILIELEILKETKTKVYLSGIFSFILGIFVVSCGYFFWRYLLEKGYSFSRSYIEYVLFVPAITLSVGFIFISNSFNKYNHYRKNFRYNVREKQKIESLLKLYNKKYEYKITLGEEIHDVKEVFFDIKIF